MLKGFDPVSYFIKDAPVKGQAEYKKEYEYGTYLFSSSQNLQQFNDNPEKYVPQYGGFCSKGVSYAIRAGGDPLAYAIRDDRLFIFANEYAKDYWRLDPVDLIGKADGYWQDELKGRSVKWTNLKRFVFRVPHYKTYPEEFADYEKRSGKKAPALPN
jgi:YHS domain-containing protein